MNDDAKKILLARRARFVAAAVAGLAVACGKDRATSEPCLSIAAPQDAEPPTPQPCLTAPMPRPPELASPPDAAAPAPRPCLTISPVSPPPPPPKDGGKK